MASDLCAHPLVAQSLFFGAGVRARPSPVGNWGPKLGAMDLQPDLLSGLCRFYHCDLGM